MKRPSELFITDPLCLEFISNRSHDDVIKWKLFPRYWPFVRGIHRSPVNSPHKGQWRGALMFSLICLWINDWVNNGEAGDLRHYRIHYDVIVMKQQWPSDRWRLAIESTLSRRTISYRRRSDSLWYLSIVFPGQMTSNAKIWCYNIINVTTRPIFRFSHIIAINLSAFWLKSSHENNQ